MKKDGTRKTHQMIKNVSALLPKSNLKSGILKIGERALIFPKNSDNPRRILWLRNTSPNHAILLKGADKDIGSHITIDPDSEKFFEFHMLGFADQPDENGVRRIIGCCEWMDDVYLENPSDSIVFAGYQAMELTY